MRAHDSVDSIKHSRFFNFLKFLLKRFNIVRVPEVSASLTFTCLLALVPILTVILVLISAFPMFNGISESLNSFINQTIVPSGADTIMSYLSTFQSKASNLTAIGIVMLLVTSLMLIRTIDTTFNRIWNVTEQRSFIMQFLIYWALLTVGPIAIGISLSSWTMIMKMSQLDGSFTIINQMAQIIFSVGFSGLVLTLLYKLVPNRFVPTKHALIGGIITACLIEFARRGFAWYISTFDGYTLIYGAFAAVPFFLLWLNLLWMLLLSGAVITASLSYWKDNVFLFKTDAKNDMTNALKILIMLNQSQESGTSLKIQQFKKTVHMGYDELGELLNNLSKRDYIFNGKKGWVLKTNANNIMLNELFNMFIYKYNINSAESINDPIDKFIEPCITNMNISLEKFQQEYPNYLK